MKLNNLPNEIQELIIEIYIDKYIECCKNTELKKLRVNNRINNICKEKKKKCNIYLLQDIKLEICSIHDNIDINIVKEIERKIKNLKICNKYSELNNIYNNIYNNIGINPIDSKVNFIHIRDIYKYEFILKKILKKYRYKLDNYCCNKNGCIIKNL